MKILLVDDHALFRAGLRLLLATISRQATILEASTLDEALALAGQHPDLALCLLDLALKRENGLAALQHLKEVAPDIAVVIVSAAEENATIRDCLDAGAMSFIPKSATPEQLTEALRQVLEGRVYLPMQIYDSAPAAQPNLTPRQLDVLGCLSRGLPTKSIARELGLSEHTVKDHLTSIYQALGARNRTDAVIRASQLGLRAMR